MTDPNPLSSDVHPAPESPPVQPDSAIMRRLLEAAFSSGKRLYQFCWYRPAFRDACSRVSESPSLDDMIQTLLALCEAQLQLPELLEAVWAANPRQAEEHFPELRGRAPAPPPRSPSSPPPGGYSEPVKVGLTALGELMQQDPQVQKTVEDFSADFGTTRQRIDELVDCKFLHDRLHELEVNCYTPVISQAHRFPYADDAVENLSNYEYNLQRITDDLSRFIEEKDCGMDTSWVTAIEQARQSLREATSNLDAGKLNLALGQLRSVLTGQPTRINERLLTTARLLGLPALVAAMARISDKLAELDLDPGKVNEFKVGVEALADLEHSLSVMIADHDQWQRLDLQMRRIEASMRMDTEELVMFWPYLIEMAEPVHHGRSETWATRLKASINDLDQAIASENPNPNKIGRCFRRFRREVSWRFYNVDKELKNGCEDLGKVGEPLAFVLRVL